MKKLKLLFSALILLTLVLGCSQVNATAPERITNVEDLANFLNEFGGNVITEGNKVTLQNDVTATQGMQLNTTAGNDLIIDLNGYKLDFSFTDSSAKAIWGDTAANLTITNLSDSNTSALKTNRGNLLTLNSSNTVTIENMDLNAYYDAVLAQGSTKYNFKNVRFNMLSSTYAYVIKIIEQSEVNINNDNNTDETNFYSGSGAGNLVWLSSNSAKATINGGTYTFEKKFADADYLIKVENGILEVQDGLFKSTYSAAIRALGGNVTLIGGIFEGKENAVSIAPNSALTVKGGTYKANPTQVSDEYGAIGFGGNKTLADIMPEAYFMTDETITVNPSTQYNETKKEVSVYAKPDIITFENAELQYNGQNQTPTVVVIDKNGNTLECDTDYTVAFPENSKDIGEYSATVTFIGKYASIDPENPKYSIVKANYDMTGVVFNDLTVTYDKNSHSIFATNLPEGVTVEYTNNNKTEPGVYEIVATFTGDTEFHNAIPNKTAILTINKANYNMSNVKFANSTFIFDNKAHSIIATGLPDGVEVTYTNNGKINAGTYKVTANFTGDSAKYNAIPSKTATLTIKPKSIANVTTTGISNKTYTGKGITQTITVLDGNKTLKVGTDYTITYSTNVNVGNATITITGEGNYTGTLKRTFEINPKGTTLSKLTAGKKQFKATWKKQTKQTSGYEIQYSTNKKFKSGKKTTIIKKNKTTSTTVKKLKTKKKYYVRIRTFKIINGKKIYSDWSKSKYVTTKK